MNRAKCPNCGFINFAGVAACHKCQTALMQDAYQQQGYQQPQFPEQQTASPDYSQQQQYYNQQQQQQYYGQQQPQYQYPQNYQYQNAYSSYAEDTKKSSSKVGILVGIVVAIIVFGIIGSVAIPNMLGTKKSKVNWQAFRSETGNFVVKMPSTPKEGSRGIPSGQTMIYYTAEVDDTASAMVSYIDFPPEAIQRVPTAKLLDAAATGATSKSGTLIKSRKDVMLQGRYQGIELELLPPSNVGTGTEMAHCRVYLVNSRLYTILVTGKDKSPIMSDSLMFLDSFQLTN